MFLCNIIMENTEYEILVNFEALCLDLASKNWVSEKNKASSDYITQNQLKCSNYVDLFLKKCPGMDDYHLYIIMF